MEITLILVGSAVLALPPGFKRGYLLGQSLYEPQKGVIAAGLEVSCMILGTILITAGMVNTNGVLLERKDLSAWISLHQTAQSGMGLFVGLGLGLVGGFIVGAVKGRLFSTNVAGC